jgi:hypothetical protein
MTHVFTALQALGLVAVLVGFALALPPPMAMVVDGILVLLVAVACEVAARRGPPAPSDPRRRANVRGVE